MAPSSAPSVRTGGNVRSDTDVWFLPGFGHSQDCFRQAFQEPIAADVRLLTFDLPGLGESPARPAGLTVLDCAEIWRRLILIEGSSRKAVLVAHSVAGIIATETVRMLDRPPALTVSVEGNLTAADAYYSGQASRYDDCITFHRALLGSIGELVTRGEVPVDYLQSLQSADPNTLWTLGRSVVPYAEPGSDFLALPGPKIYYWDERSTTPQSRDFLARSNLRQRRFTGAGHWPMLTRPAEFYAALRADIMAAA